MATILPAILVESADAFKSRLQSLEGVDTYSIDIMDGSFVEPTTFFGAGSLEGLDLDTSFELDLMVEDPMPIIEAWAKNPQTIRAIVHVEIKQDVREIINTVHDLGLEAGIALLPGTKVEDVEHLINDVDMVLVRGNEPGYSGREFDTSMLKKIQKLKEDYSHISINVDIGVNELTIPSIVEAGASHLSINSAIFKADDPQAALRHLKTLV